MSIPTNQELDAREAAILARLKAIEEMEAKAGVTRKFAAARSQRGVPKIFSTLIFAVVLLAMVGIYYSGDGKRERPREFEPVSSRTAPDLPPPPPAPTPAPPPPPAPPRGESVDKLAEMRLKSAIIIRGEDAQVSSAEPTTYSMDEDGNLIQPPVSASSVQPNSAIGTHGDPNSRFYNQATSAGVDTTQARQQKNLDYKILQGKFVDGVMETAIRSDLPGMIRAVVTNPVYAEHGRTVLLPYGTRLIGIYSSQLRKGQAEVFVVWKRAIRPDGIDVALNSPGTDKLGRAGLGGVVDHHFMQIFGVAALTSIIGAQTANYHVGPDDQPNSADRYRSAVQDSAARTSVDILDQYASIPPTVHVDQGTRIQIFVNRDLDFSQVLNMRAASAEPAFVMIN